MKTKIKKISFTLMMIIFAFAVLIALAWSTVANNAFATDDEAAATDTTNQEFVANDADQNAEEANAEEQANETCKVSFNVGGVEAGKNITYTLTKDKVLDLSYKIGDKIDFYKGASVTLLGPTDGFSTIQLVYSDASVSHNWAFRVHAPIGYDFEKFEPSSITSLQEDTNFIVKFKKSDVPYSLKVVTSNTDLQPLPNIEFKYYKADWSDYMIKQTDSNGECLLENLPSDYIIGIVAIEHNDYCDFFEPIRDLNYDNNHFANRQAILYPKSMANLFLNKPAENHKYFELSVIVTMASGQVALEASTRKDSYIYYIPLDYSGTWKVESDGTIILDKNIPGMNMVITIKAINDEGYTLSKWKRTTENNAVEYLDLGHPFEVATGDVLNLEPVYDIAPQPEPTPDPTPGEDVNSTPQTGDCSPLVPFVLLAVLASGVLLYTRKASQK